MSAIIRPPVLNPLRLLQLRVYIIRYKNEEKRTEIRVAKKQLSIIKLTFLSEGDQL